MSLTVALREELAHVAVDDPARLVAEAAGLLDAAGSLHVTGAEDGTTVGVDVRCTVGGAARRLRRTLVEHLGHQPGLLHQRGRNLRGGDAYVLRVEGRALRQLGILDAAGRPSPRTLGALDPAGYISGVLMGAGSLSGAGQPVHLEISPARSSAVPVLGEIVPGARVVGERVVVKSGPEVLRVLDMVDASRTSEAFQTGLARRDLRRRVTRSVNADRANLRRATAAAAAQIRAIEAVVAAVGWDGVPDDLVGVALARIANPEASLADLGELQDPPVGKATVHRRLRRLADLAGEVG